MKVLNKSWWDFKGTVNGTQYFLRPLWGILFLLPGVLVTIGAIKSAVMKMKEGGEDYHHSFGDNVEGLIEFAGEWYVAAGGLGVLLFITGYVAAIWLNLSTINKRLNSITPDQKVLGWFFAIFSNLMGWLFIILKNGTPKPEGAKEYIHSHWRKG